MPRHACIFCGRAKPLVKITKEYLFSQWVDDILTPELLGPDRSFERTTTGRDGTASTKRWPTEVVAAIEAAVVCGSQDQMRNDGCNDGWMSELDGRAKELLGWRPGTVGSFPAVRCQRRAGRGPSYRPAGRAKMFSQRAIKARTAPAQPAPGKACGSGERSVAQPWRAQREAGCGNRRAAQPGQAGKGQPAAQAPSPVSPGSTADTGKLKTRPQPPAPEAGRQVKKRRSIAASTE